MADNAPFVLAVVIVWGIVAVGLLEARVRGWWRRRAPDGQDPQAR